MIIHAVDLARKRTRNSDSGSESRARRGSRWLVALMLALVLAACGASDEVERPATSGEQPAVAVETMEPAEGAPSPMPTSAVPTAAFTPTPPAPLAALVNGQYVFLADYELRVAQYEEALVQQGIDPNTSEGQADLAQARRDVLEGLIDGVLIEQGAVGLGIGVTEEELEGQVEADISAGGGQAAFEEWLQATGQTRDDYKEMLRQAMISQRVMEAVSSEAGQEAEQVHARHILVDNEETAQQLQAMLQEGADFAALAREYSQDAATKDNGGDLGWFPRGLVAAEFESAAFALQPGQVSGVVQLGEGYHILQVVEREAARPLTPEQQLDLKLAMFDEWLTGQKASAVIERFVGE
jgi:foldase protein PrsA